MEEFLKLFGHITVANIVELAIACTFAYQAYKKIKDFFIAKAEEDAKHKQEVLDMIKAVQELVKDRELLLENQNKMQEQLVEMHKDQAANAERLTQLETNINNRERSKLRDRLLQSYRYYTSEKHNPLQQWTKMEADAFQSLFVDYEEIGGNGYVHSVVQPAMRALEVIEMDNAEAISNLMSTRR